MRLYLAEIGPAAAFRQRVLQQHDTAEPSTSGGISDARFIRVLCPVVEFGLVGATMHAVDEQVPVRQLRDLEAVYGRLIARYFETFASA